MTDRSQDEALLIDELLGRCDAATAEQVRRRLAEDESFRRLHGDLSRALGALGLLAEREPPETLVNDTLARVRGARRTEALLAREEIRRGVVRPTFSWRELATLAAAVVVLAAIFVPSIREARRQAVVAQCASNLGRIGTSLQNFALSHDDRLPTVDTTRHRWLSGNGEPAVSNSQALFRLVRDGYEGSPVVFQCPAVPGRSFVVESGMIDFPSQEQVAYSYQHAIGPAGLRITAPELANVAAQMAILADRTPLFERGRFQRQAMDSPLSPNHDERGQNVLYLDMHVQWQPTADVGVRGDNIFLANGVRDYQGTETPGSPTDTFLLPAHSGRK